MQHDTYQYEVQGGWDGFFEHTKMHSGALPTEPNIASAACCIALLVSLLGGRGLGVPCIPQDTILSTTG